MHKKDYELIASVIRNKLAEFEPPRWLGGPAMEGYDEKRDRLIRSGVVSDIALDFARRLKEAHPSGGYEFDTIKFLDACSSNKELYPLSELWDE